MPYRAGQRLGAETASKLGHLDVLNSTFVNQIIHEFEKPQIDEESFTLSNWQNVPLDEKPLPYIFAIDGSLQVLKSSCSPQRELAFVKTALFNMDPKAISKLDPDFPHPSQLRKVMTDAALFHATVFPLKNIAIKDTKWLEGVRRVVFDSFHDPTLSGEPYETLKWILYKKWSPSLKSKSPAFECPECFQDLQGMDYDSDTMICPECGSTIYASDILGLHMEMTEESAGESLASAYMLLHETMLLFTAIRIFWEKKNIKVLGDSLFLKDGPLTLRSQYSKIVPNLRDFLTHAKQRGIDIHICGQEKSGKFFDYLQGINRFVLPKEKEDPPRFSILSHQFIRDEVQRVRDSKNPYGYRTNYGEKILLKQNAHHAIVINIPTGQYLDNEQKPNQIDDFIGMRRILATIPNLISYRHEGALVPIELVNGIASLSSYPSAQVLKLFSGLE